jgi:hypothetical protein
MRFSVIGTQMRRTSTVELLLRERLPVAHLGAASFGRSATPYS